jgi:hypothetical protein
VLFCFLAHPATTIPLAGHQILALWTKSAGNRKTFWTFMSDISKEKNTIFKGENATETLLDVLMREEQWMEAAGGFCGICSN